MSTPLREIAAILGIEVDDEEVEKADKKIEGFVGKLKEAGKVMAEAFAAHEVVEFFKSQVENAAHLQDLAEKLDIGVDELKMFGFAAASAGLDADSAASMLGRFERSLSGAGKGGGAAAQELAKLGIKTKGRETLDVIRDMADAFQSMPTHAQKVATAIKVFGRQGLAMVPILEKGSDALNELFNESKELGSGLGGDFYKNAKEAREEFEHFEYGIKSLKERALAAILPYIIELGKWLKDVTRDVIEFTKRTESLKTVIIFLGGVGMIRLLAGLKELAKTFGILKPTIGETVAAFGKFIYPLALLALLYLALDSVYEMIVGNKSALGDLLDKWFGIGTAAKVALVMNAILQDTLALFGDIASVIEDTLLAAVETVVDEVKGLAMALKNLATGDFKGAWEALKSGNAEAAGDLNKRGNSILKAGGRMVGGADTKHLEQLDALLGAGIDPRTLQSGLLGHATRGSVAATRAGIVAQNADNPFAHGWRVAVPRHGGAAGHGKGTTIHQTNHNNVTVKTASENPDRVGKAAAGGVEKGIQRGNLNAHKAALVP